MAKSKTRSRTSRVVKSGTPEKSASRYAPFGVVGAARRVATGSETMLVGVECEHVFVFRAVVLSFVMPFVVVL